MKRGNVRKFGRTKNQRNAFVRSLVTALVASGKITTTRARAKVVRSEAERLITKSRTNSLAVRRYLLSRVGTKAVDTLLNELGTRYSTRTGGYTRIVPLPPRRSDGSPMSLVEFV